MDSRAKQRLTGAVILVALIVLLVPELLTGPREAHAPANADNGEGLREYTIDMDTQDRGTPGRAAPPADTSVTLPPVADPMNATPGRAVPGEAATPEPAAAPTTTTNPMAPPVTPNNVAATPARPAPVAEPAPRVEPPKPASNQRAESGTFVVQVGSFRSKENADGLVRDMTAKGFAAFIAPTTSNGHELYRVRVGPTRSRASAEALAAELKRVGQPGSIVPIP
jgi:DedD protein